jgi:hypothetical protein
MMGIEKDGKDRGWGQEEKRYVVWGLWGKKALMYIKVYFSYCGGGC